MNKSGKIHNQIHHIDRDIPGALAAQMSTSTNSGSAVGAGNELNLFYSPGACSFAPHILLQASGLPFKITNSDVTKGFPKEFEKLNPKKQVPFLELEPGLILTEVPAIFTAISQLVPEKKFLGDNNLEVLRSYEWFNFLSGQVHVRRFGVFFRPFRFVNDESLHPMVKDMAKKSMVEAFEIIENKLKDTKPFDPTNFKAIDAYLFVFYRWANLVGLDLAPFPTYKSRMEEVLQSEPVQKAADAEGISPTVHGKKKDE